VTYTATVTGPSGDATPSGAITWSITPPSGSMGCTNAGSTTLSGSGNTATATCVITASLAGTYSTTASVGSDANYNAAGPSAADTFSVAKATPSIAVTHNPASPSIGQNVTFTATVTGPSGGSTPSGAVTWTLTGAATSCSSTTPLSGSGNVATATCTITATNGGTYSASASVAADSNYNAAGPSNTDSFTVGVTETLLGSATDSTSGTKSSSTGNVSTTNGRTELILVYRQSSVASDAVQSITGPFTGASAITGGMQDLDNRHHMEAWIGTGNGTTGSVTVTFQNAKNVATVIDVIELAGNNTTTPIHQVGTATGSSSSSTVSLPGASASNGEVAFVASSSDTTIGTPAGFRQVDSQAGATGTGFSVKSLFASAAQTSTSANLGTTATWGTIGLEINHA
jgi:hypothetical protein